MSTDDNRIPTQKDISTGKTRAEEAFSSAFGQELFDRDALEVFQEGTKENPIQILSNEHERYVGISVEVSE